MPLGQIAVSVGVRVDKARVEQDAARVDRHGAGRGGQARRPDLADGVAGDQNVAGIGAVRARVEQATTADDRDRAGLDRHEGFLLESESEPMWQYTLQMIADEIAARMRRPA
jgi:hypothetical protein